MRFLARRPSRSRRGLTLVEMLVTVALLVLIMTIIVQIFASATGAMSASRAYQELDQGLRRLDSTIRNDLRGVTARFTPPLNPKDNLGYFEYSENAFADLQGEDADDTLRFTTKAPDGQPFTGRMWLPLPANQSIQPILITSQYAEIIYFLRGDKLYRRVLLIAPERQSVATFGSGATGGYPAVSSSWLGMNDLSARPPRLVGTVAQPPVLNTLGDLTNRENRAFAPRFYPDPDGDGIVDANNDGVPDFYPTFYSTTNRQVSAFPYIYPGAYSRPEPESVTNTLRGWIHSLDPSATGATFNHSPLLQGDSLAVPGATGTQTWWGFPTWRETFDPDWQDPYPTAVTPPASKTQPPGLRPFPPDALPTDNTNLLPAVSTINQPFSDGVPTTASPFTPGTTVWDDDLIMTGVRSFDIKAYDNAFAGYADLGWGDDIGNPAVYNPNYYPPGSAPTTPPFIVSNTTPVVWPPNSSLSYDILSQTFAHEGRMPPTTADGRFDPQAAGYRFSTNVGDNAVGVIRLRRVWDSWSTDYTQAPASGYDSAGVPTGLPFAEPTPAAGFPRSFPPPYPMPLRGIQIQIRVVDPRNQHVKVLTIRQDFSDKL